MNDQILSKVKNVYTLSDRSRLVNFLDKLSLDNVDENLKQSAAVYFNEDPRSFSEEDISQLRESLTSIKEVKVVLSFDPTQEFIASLFKKLKEVITYHFILSIVKDEGIIGGILVFLEGKKIDLSMNKKLSTYFDTIKND